MRTVLEIGECIAAERNSRGFTQEMLAEKIGCETNTLSRWECGAITMKIDSLQKIACALDVSTDYLLGISRKENVFPDSLYGLDDAQRDCRNNDVLVDSSSKSSSELMKRSTVL